MNSLTPMIVAIIVLTLVGCDDVAVDGSSSQGKVEVEENKIPESYAEALDALDAMFSEEELETCRNDTVDLCHVHNQISMRLRNDWGLWGDSKLKVYFSERGIANSDWISVAIFESWIERLKTGSFDETAIIAKYAKFAETSAVEQGGADQPATRPESKSEGKNKPQPESKVAPLVCELGDLPQKGHPGEEVKVVVRLRNTSDKPVPLLRHHVEYVTSVGTGVGVSVRRVAKRDAEAAPDEPPAPELPAALARLELLDGAHPEKPEDILAILTDKEIPAGKTVSIPVVVALPKEPGEYEVHAYVRSWTYFGIRNGIPQIDTKEVHLLYIERVSSKSSLVVVRGK